MHGPHLGGWSYLRIYTYCIDIHQFFVLSKTGVPYAIPLAGNLPINYESRTSSYGRFTWMDGLTLHYPNGRGHPHAFHTVLIPSAERSCRNPCACRCARRSGNLQIFLSRWLRRRRPHQWLGEDAVHDYRDRAPRASVAGLRATRDTGHPYRSRERRLALHRAKRTLRLCPRRPAGAGGAQAKHTNIMDRFSLRRPRRARHFFTSYHSPLRELLR